MPSSSTPSSTAAGTLQRVVGGVYVGMGLATMAFPGPLLRLSVPAAKLPSAASEAWTTLVLVFQCFGAQAVVSGSLVLGGPAFTRQTWKMWMGLMAPFVVFDFLAWRKERVTTLGAVGDLAGNVVFMGAAAVALSSSHQ